MNDDAHPCVWLDRVRAAMVQREAPALPVDSVASFVVVTEQPGGSSEPRSEPAGGQVRAETTDDPNMQPNPDVVLRFA